MEISIALKLKSDHPVRVPDWLASGEKTTILETQGGFARL
jgi:hypothetical protein